MKKITALLIMFALILSLCACGSTAAGNQTPSEEAAVTPEVTEKPETVLEKLIREAGEGVPDALLELGEKYLYGSVDVGQDTVKGLELLTQAAGSGNVSAMKDLGNYYIYSKDGKDSSGLRKPLTQVTLTLCTVYTVCTGSAISSLGIRRSRQNIR